MDSLTFISKLIESLAWPLSLVIVAWLMRAELRELLRLVKKLKAGPVEAEFDREVRSLRVEIETREPTAPTTPATRAQTDPLLELAARHPRAAILEAWRAVEVALLRLANSRDLLPPGLDKTPSRHVIGVITKDHLLAPEEIALYYDLRNLRNQAAHATDFDPSEIAALDYVELSKGFINAANQAAQQI
ncbi:MAG: hypothetical protein EPO47_11175 [Rugosibacter sp.]|nr:MAG: hypothetical protein EPO47_11175 [Rugosibacter sp.]